MSDYYFKSFHNGGSLFYCFPLFESLLFIFKTDNMNRVKVARILSMGKYQSLRVRLGIVALKNILSFVFLPQSLLDSLHCNSYCSFNFIEEKVILALKNGISKLDELSKSFDKCLDTKNMQIFKEIIIKVATTNRNSENNDNNDTKEPSFFLKKDLK